MKTYIQILVISLSLSVGCASLLPLLPTVVTAVQDALLIVDRIEQYVDMWFVAKPNPESEKDIRTALDKTRIALDVALRATKGTEELSREDITAAFVEFQNAYIELLKLVQPLGIREASYATTAEYSTSGTGLIVPSPLAMSYR